MRCNERFIWLVLLLCGLFCPVCGVVAEEAQPEKVDIHLILHARMPDGTVKKINGSVKYRSLDPDVEVQGVCRANLTQDEMNKVRLPVGKYEFRYVPSFEVDSEEWKYCFRGRQRIRIEESKTYVVRVEAVETARAKIRVIDTGTGEAPPNNIIIKQYVEWCPSVVRQEGIDLDGEKDVSIRVVPGLKYQLVCDREWDHKKLKSKPVVLSDYVDKPFVWKIPYLDGCLRLRFRRRNEKGEVVPFRKYKYATIMHSGNRATSPRLSEDGSALVGIGEEGWYHIRGGREYRIEPEMRGKGLKGYTLVGDPTFHAPEKVDGVKTITWMVEKQENVPVSLKVRSAETGKPLYPCSVKMAEVGSDKVAFEGQIREPRTVTVRPGKYEITARAEKHVGKRVTWTVNEDFSAPAIKLTHHPEIHCMAVDGDGNPVPADFVVVYPDSSEGGRAQAADGVADLRYDPGRRSTVACLFTREDGAEQQKGYQPIAWAHKVLDSEKRKQGKVTFRRPEVVDVRVKYKWTGSLEKTVRGQSCKLFFLRDKDLYPRSAGGFKEPPTESEMTLQPGRYEAFLYLIGDSRDKMGMQSYAVGKFTVTDEPDQVMKLTIGDGPEPRHLENTVETRISEAVKVINDKTVTSRTSPEEPTDTQEQPPQGEMSQESETGSEVYYVLAAVVALSGICVLLLVVKRARQDNQK